MCFTSLSFILMLLFIIHMLILTFCINDVNKKLQGK